MSNNEDEVVDIVEQAKNEIIKARKSEVKTKIKSKLEDIERAKLIVKNLERELEVILEKAKAELTL